jgi:hypothetical protein
MPGAVPASLYVGDLSHGLTQAALQSGAIVYGLSTLFSDRHLIASQFGAVFA